MNAQLLSGSKSMLAAVDDGWFPSKVGAVNKRFGTPHFLLTGLFVVGLTPVLFQVPLDVLASSVAGVAQILFILILLASLRLRYVHPELIKAAPFKINAPVHWVLAVAGIAICGYQAYQLISLSMTPELTVVMVIVLAVAAIWAAIRYPHVKRVLAARVAASGTDDAEPIVLDTEPDARTESPVPEEVDKAATAPNQE